MAEKPIIIIKRKKGGGHGGAHGGAWKVAFADFMTAMMAFFLVMWLMGSDEETKASIAHYFNHPNTPWKSGRDPDSDEAHPMGEMPGSGDSIQNGLDGLYPEDLIEKPVRPVQPQAVEFREISDLVQTLTEGEAYAFDVNVDYLKFSLSEEVMFKMGTTDLKQEAQFYLAKLSEVFRTFPGYITIEGHTDNSTPQDGKPLGNWELSFARAVSVMNFLVEKQQIHEDKFVPIGSAGRKAVASNEDPIGRQKNRRIEFTLTKKRSL